MNISIEHFFDIIDALPKNKPFDYVNPGNNKAVLVSVDKQSEIINIEKHSSDGKVKSAGMSKESVRIFVNNSQEKVPFSVDSIFNGSGSSRSTWEALLANTSEYYTCKVNNQKHLVWVPDAPHEIGQVMSYNGPFYNSSDVHESDVSDKAMSKDEIVDRLVDIYTDPAIPSSAAGGIFIFQYGKHVVDIYTPKELLEWAHAKNESVKTSYSVELNAAYLMFKYFRSHRINMPSIKHELSKVVCGPYKSNVHGEGRKGFIWTILKYFFLKDGLKKMATGGLLRFPEKYAWIGGCPAAHVGPDSEDYDSIILSDGTVLTNNCDCNDNEFKKGVDDFNEFYKGQYRIIIYEDNGEESYYLVEVKMNKPLDIYFHALRTKPFLLLAGISGTGKSRIVRELAFRSCPSALQDADHTTPGNYLMVEVKPNWHDSSELLGYYSNITKSYHFTKFIDFLVLAHANPDVPFFVCLDEMNLAPVEQYFAEFLSVLETRRYPKGDMTHIKTGRLVDKKYMISHSGWGKDEDLTLPDNLFVIGTVNMDDTTHQFSRKVIDRAMTIEMNGGNLESMFGNSKNMDYTGEFSLNDFKPTYVNADEVLEKYGSHSIREDAPAKLNAINECLSGTPFEVSYRVLNELCIYIGVLLDSGIDYPAALKKAVDSITLMKILPRIEGDEDMFRIKGENNNKLEQLKKLFTEDSESYKKIQEMLDRLGNGFTRFWP